MAVAATGVVIYDPLNGSNDNAGYFDADLANAGTDYPRTQAAAILTATDLACTTGGTTLTSATGGFTDAMIGNGIYIKSGTHFTVGLYVITGRTDTNTVTIDRDPTDGSDASSGTGSVGGRRAVLLDTWLETPYNVAGMTHEIWATGTHCRRPQRLQSPCAVCPARVRHPPMAIIVRCWPAVHIT